MLGSEKGALAVEQYNVYQEGAGIFGSEMARKSAMNTPGHMWWASYGSSVPQLQKIAMRLLSQPAAASSSEQSWSEYDFVHNKKRNRLKTETASKLVFVHANLRMLNRIQARAYKRHERLHGVEGCANATSPSIAESNKLYQHSLFADGLDGNCSDTDEVEEITIEEPLKDCSGQPRRKGAQIGSKKS
jgi:hypothetical protein